MAFGIADILRIDCRWLLKFIPISPTRPLPTALRLANAIFQPTIDIQMQQSPKSSEKRLCSIGASELSCIRLASPSVSLMETNISNTGCDYAFNSYASLSISDGGASLYQFNCGSLAGWVNA